MRLPRIEIHRDGEGGFYFEAVIHSTVKNETYRFRSISVFSSRTKCLTAISLFRKKAMEARFPSALITVSGIEKVDGWMKEKENHYVVEMIGEQIYILHASNLTRRQKRNRSASFRQFKDAPAYDIV